MSSELGNLHATNRKQIVIAALAMRTSAVDVPVFDRSDSTFIFFAWARSAFSWLNTWLTI